LLKLVLGASLSLAAVGCGDGGGVPVSLTHSSVLAKAGLESYWQLPLQLPAGERIDRLYLLEENLYCLTNTNYLIAIDAAKGVRKWARKIAEPRVKVFPPCHGNNVAMKKELPGIRQIAIPLAPEVMDSYNLVMINTPDYMLAFERDTGELLRNIDFDRRPEDFCANTGGGCDNRVFYVGSTRGICYAIRLNEGVMDWYMPTGRLLSASPRCHSPGDYPRVFVAGEDKELYIARSGEELTRLWPPEGTRPWPAMAGPVVAEFHVDDRACFIPCETSRVYAFPLSGGEALWRYTCNGPLLDPIQVSENTVFQYARGDKLYAINPANGELRWALPEGRRVLASMTKDDLPLTYLVDAARNLVVADEILGTVRARIPLTGCSLFADNTTAPAIYLGSRNGQLYCLRQLGAGHLTAESLMKGNPKMAPVAGGATEPVPEGTTP
jgi:outer membrane protein assembly factor BamB